MAQNCGCDSDQCCSKWGYCGTDDDYCGDGCQSGPCYSTPSSSNVSGAKVVTEAFFDGIIDQANSGCAKKSFYTRSAFIDALDSYPRFGTEGSEADSLLEIVAFFAHVTHETGRKDILSSIFLLFMFVPLDFLHFLFPLQKKKKKCKYMK